MRLLIDTYKKTGSLHHAYALEGDRTDLLSGLYQFLEDELKVVRTANPDFWCGEFTTFGIDDARTVKDMQNKKATSEDRRVFVVAAQTMTTEAQNSLLKVLEEPTDNTYFFLVVPSSSILLPTLQSRLIVVPSQSEQSEVAMTMRATAQEFLAADNAARLVLVGKQIEDKATAEAITFLNHCEAHLHESQEFTQRNPDYVWACQEIHTCRGYLRGRGASLKGVLEYLSIIIPQTKKR